jgi:hypothetical protein
MAGFAASLEDLARALQQGMAKAAVQWAETARACTFTDSGDLVGITGHGFSVGDVVVFPSKASTTGLTTYTRYYVKTVPSADTFTISATSGGSTVALTTDGTGTCLRVREARVRFANQAAGNPEVKTINYEGDNVIVPSRIMQSITFDLDSDAIPIGLHTALFGLSETTSNLPDSYTSAYGLYGSAAEQTGKTIGFWFETQWTYTDSSGVQSTKTARVWCPVCTLTPGRPPEAKSADKPTAWRYSVSVTDFAPTVDVAGVALPITGAPVIIMTK